MKKVLVISICFSVSFVIVVLFLSHKEMEEIEELKKAGDLSGQSQRFERIKDSLRSKLSGSQEYPHVSTPDETPFEKSRPDVAQLTITPKELSKKALKEVFEEEHQDEFEAFWKDIEGVVEQYLIDLRGRVDESVAQIEPLFEDAAFYKAQLEPLKRQENWPEFSIAWSGFRQAEGRLYGLYVFLREGPAREHFGDLYLSTPEYARLEVFGENWAAQRTHRTIYR